MSDDWQSLGSLADQIMEDLHQRRTVVSISSRQQDTKANASVRKYEITGTKESVREFVRDSARADEAVIKAGKAYG